MYKFDKQDFWDQVRTEKRVLSRIEAANEGRYMIQYEEGVEDEVVIYNHSIFRLLGLQDHMVHSYFYFFIHQMPTDVCLLECTSEINISRFNDFYLDSLVFGGIMTEKHNQAIYDIVENTNINRLKGDKLEECMDNLELLSGYMITDYPYISNPLEIKYLVNQLIAYGIILPYKDVRHTINPLIAWKGEGRKERIKYLKKNLHKDVKKLLHCLEYKLFKR